MPTRQDNLKSGNRRVYTWWVCSYSVIILLSILLNLMGYSSATRTLQKELEQSNRAIAEHIRGIYDAQFSQLQDAAYMIARSTAVEKLNTARELSLWQRQQYVRDALISKQSAVLGSVFSPRAWLLIRDKNMCLEQALSSLDIGHEVDFADCYSDTDAWLEDVFSTMGYSYRILTAADGTRRFFLYYVRPEIVNPGNLAVLMEVDRRSVNDALASIASDDGGDFYLTDQEGKLLFASSKEMGLPTQHGSSRYAVSKTDSAVAPLTYHYYQPYDDYVKELAGVKRVFVLSYLLCLAIGGGLVALFVKINVERRRQMETRLTEQGQYISQNVLRQLLRGKEQLNVNNSRILTENNIILNGRRFVIVVYDYAADRRKGQESTLPAYIRDYFTRTAADAASVYFCQAEGLEVAIFNVFDTSLDADYLVPALEELAVQLKKNYSADFACGISRPTHAVSHWEKSFAQAVESLDARFLEQERHVFLYEEDIDHTMAYAYDEDMRRALLSELLQADMDGVEGLLDRIFGQELNRGLNLTTLRILTSEIGNTIRKAALQLGRTDGLDFETFFRTSDTMAQVRNANQAKEQLLAMAQELCRVYQEAQQSVGDARFQKVLDYIGQHYSNLDLSVGMLADEFHITPSYMSRYFKRNMGEGLNDYIVKLRLEHAKELIRSQPDMPLMSVAKEVGFSSAEVFSRAFKRYEGLSPSRFRAYFSEG